MTHQSDWIADAVDRWYSEPLEPDDGISEVDIRRFEQHVGIQLPAAVAELYLRVGNRVELFSGQDTFLSISELNLQDNELRICRENQGCFHWFIKLSDLPNPDPPVYLKQTPDNEEQQVADRFSDFAYRFFHYQHAVGGGRGLKPQVQFAVLEAQMTEEVAKQLELDQVASPTPSEWEMGAIRISNKMICFNEIQCEHLYILSHDRAKLELVFKAVNAKGEFATVVAQFNSQ